MERLDGKQILLLGKKHKNWFEDVVVEIFPYVINNNRYYLAYYMKKFTMDVKEIAVVSPDSTNREEALKALKPLIFFTITFGKVETYTKTRSELEFNAIQEVYSYLRNVLLSDRLKKNLTLYYERSFKIMGEVIGLQEEMMKLREKVNSMAQRILTRGYFLDEEIDEALTLFSENGWIQYQQLKDNYRYRHDFDIIYENRNNPEIIQFNKFRDEKTLYYMTSKIAEIELKKSLKNVTDNIEMSNYTKDDYYDYWKTKFMNNLTNRYEELRYKIRYP